MTGPLRQEFVLAGCLLAAGGFVAALVGFDQVQESPLESAISVIERVSRNPAPPGLHPSKFAGYVLLLGGLLSFATGIILILKSRVSAASTHPSGSSRKN